MAGYLLAVDLGTTRTAAAIFRDGQVSVVGLGQRDATIPTLLVVEADGSVAVGEAAQRRAIDAPERVVREVKRRVGDDAPVLVAGTPWAAELLLARVLRHVVDRVAEEQGAAPDVVVLTHPANWGRYKLDLLVQAARQVGVEPVELVAEPVAAAAWYAADHRVPEGGVVAVYDLGGGTFDAAVVRRVGDRFELLGVPDGVERFGGVDIDAAVLGVVTEELGTAWTTLDATDPDAVADVTDLRARCVEAKEALSAETTATISVRLPTVRTSIRLTREELESMVRAPLGETIVALQRTIASAGVTPADLHTVLLVGGASRMPLVGQLVTSALGVPVAVDVNPKLAVAAGAAHVGASEVTPTPAPAPAAPAVSEPAAGPGPRHRRWVPVAAVVAAVAVVAAAAFVLGTGGDDDDDDAREVAGDVSGGDALRIGVLVPDTGDLSFLAPSFRAAVQVASEDIEASGGVLGSPVEIVVVDSGDPGSDEELRAIQELVDVGVSVVVGPAGRVTGADVVTAVTDAGLVGCSPTASEADDTGDGWFRTIGHRDLLSQGLADVLTNEGLSSVAVVSDESAAEPVDVDSLEQVLEGSGIEVVSDHDVGDSAIGSDLAVGAPDAVVFLAGDRLPDVLPAAQDAGVDGPWLGDESLEDEEVAAAVAGDGAVVGGLTFASDPEGEGDVGDRIVVVTEGDDPLYGEYVYDCIVLTAVATERAQSTDPDDILAEVVEASRGGEPCTLAECLVLARDGADLDYRGASGPVDLDDDGDPGSAQLDRFRYTDGSLEYFDRLTVGDS